MKAIDTSDMTTGLAQTIVDAGYQAVGVYLRPDRCSAAMVAELRAAGLKIWSLYEKGHPTSDGFFSAKQGTIDGHAAASFATQTLVQPQGTQIYACVDYDPDHNDENGPTIRGVIADYMRAFGAAIAANGYVASVYGSGRTCRILTEIGLAQSGWLCVSSSFAEHADYRPHAAIVQSKVVSRNWDGDEVQDPKAAGLW